jgi:uncharacterized protein YgfB (UPF0149 family)
MQKLDYDDISSQLEEWAGISSSSEIHGLISGLGSVALAGDLKLVKEIVMRHLEEEEACSDSADYAIQIMQEAVIEQYKDIDFAFDVLLPDDEEEIHSRIRALSQWVQGFLVGFGTGVKAEEGSFSTEAQEVLRDLVEISNVAEDLAHDGEEEDEVALTEIEEYVRAGAMILYTEFGLAKADSGEKAAESPNSETYH